MPSDKLQEELTTPVRCSDCGEITPANDGTCVHCGAPLNEIEERKSIEKQSSEELGSTPDSSLPLSSPPPTPSDSRRNNKTLDLSKELASYHNVEAFAVERHATTEEEETVGVVVEKIAASDEETAAQRRRRAHFGEPVCPFEKGDILHLEIGGFPKKIQLLDNAFCTQLASGFFAIDLDEVPPITSLDDTQYQVHLSNTPPPYFFEVYLSGHAPATNLSTSHCQLFRSQVGEGRYQGKPFRVFDEADSYSLEYFVEQAKRQLPFDQFVALFRAILDLTICAHSQKSLVLGISPWTIRILNDPKDCKSCRISHEELEAQSLTDDDDEFEPTSTKENIAEAQGVLDTLDLPASSPYERREQTDAESEPVYRAVFDGLEMLYPMGEMPDSIPMVNGFAAPEFLLGVCPMVGPESDIFSLGALLYFLVSGSSPPNSIHSQYAPALPMRNFRPDFPPGLEAVVARATRIDPKERYENVRQLRNDFEHAIAQIQQRELDCNNPRSYSVVRVAVDKHIGIAKGKRMPLNQDSVFCAAVDTGRLALVVIADGVTRATYGRGDIASKFVTDAAEMVWKDVEATYNEKGTFDPDDTINRILVSANDQLVDYVNTHYYPFSGGLHEVMGSTVIVACIDDGHVTLGTLGDSRAYLYTDIGLEQLTVDHNLWTLNVLEGAVPVDRVRSMPFADALARCVGSFRVVDRKLVALPPEPDIHRFYFRNGDRLLISTDGLTDYVGINRDDVESAIHKVLRREPDPALAALELILLANRGGGGDNIGIGIIDFH